MTDNEIIRSLEKQIEKAVGYINCQDSTIAELTAKNNRQKEQIESLIAGQETLQKYIAEKDAEIERLKSPVLAINNFDLSDEEFKEKIKNIPAQIIVYNEEQIKSEAVKECLDKIEQMDVSESDNYIMVKKIEFDNLVKEMVGE